MSTRTAETLAVNLADEFHDVIDGDDPPDHEHKVLDSDPTTIFKDGDGSVRLYVRFESGKEFEYRIREVYR